ncbi:MAG: 3-oxoacyl-ACP synthase [Desulfobacca sp.]|nr:3-oxoacyl-ACP synthase [Desulfobacca sp.]
MEAFIRGIGNISPQHTFNNSLFLEEVVPHQSNRMVSQEPNYKEYIKPIQIRRMSRVLKMGVTAAAICLKDADIDIPDAIITATGLGMMEDTEKFLTSIIDNGEILPNPTAFIQSTHNTVGATIAVGLKCHRYNFTYVHGFFSFESALTDSLMRLEERPMDRILVGGIEEITEIDFKIREAAGFWKKEQVESLDLLQYASPGTIAGEGVAFFLLTKRPAPENYARIRDVKTIYRPGGLKDIHENINQFLEKNKLEIHHLDLVLLGFNGDTEQDGIYRWLEEKLFQNNSRAYFKHLCGEHYCASSFGLWLAAKTLKHQHIPDAILLKDSRHPGSPIRNILIYNQNKNINHSLILLSAC